MSAKTTKQGSLALPLYANKPQRRIPGTHFVAVTMYKSHDGTVQDVAVIREDGEAHLGTVHLQTKRGLRTRGWTLDAVEGPNSEKWSTLTAYVVEMAARNGIEA